MDQSRDTATVLVADDNAENRALARATLEDEGYSVITAADGEDALRAFESKPPDCVLLDIRMPGTDGFAVCSRIRASPNGADTPVVFITAFRDVETFDRAILVGGDDFLTKPIRPTELVIRVDAAVKLRRMRAELRESYELLRRQRDDLLRLQLQKEQLMAFVVHDLKNPVNSMELLAQLVLRDTELPKRSRDSVQRIREEARSLLRLVLNLLDISKSDEGRLDPRLADVDLESLVADVIEAHEAKARNAGITLRRTIETRAVAADPDLLRRVVENLFDNAIRHAPEHTEVVVTAGRRNGDVEIRVADAGGGVPPEMREKVFERYVQLESGDRVVTRAGRGLGLTFCKLAVEAHGGSIRIEDGSPGAVFCVRLPGER